MATNPTDQRPFLFRANKEVRAALKDCRELLERSHKVLAGTRQDNKPR